VSNHVLNFTDQSKAALLLQHFLLPTTLLESKKLTLLEVHMTTVAQMIEWMKTLPQDAEVDCGVEHTSGYQTCMIMQPVDIEACDVIRYTSEADRAKYPFYAGKTFVVIRGE
jgi:hypothetical protein